MSDTPETSPPYVDRRTIPAAAREGFWTARDGHRLRRIDWPGAQSPRGSMLFLPGRGDAYEKYLETLDHWRVAGWQVTAIDWRGQAGSGRLGRDAITGHISDFADWVADLAHFWAAWKARTPGPHVLVAHSMGGHLALRALAEQQVDPDAAVLIAPMLGMLPDWAPLALELAAARVMCAIGDPRRPAWKWDEKPGVPPASRVALLTHDEARYGDELWWRGARPELAMGPPSWGWLASSFASIRGLGRPGVLEAVTTPVLMIATSADRLVSTSAIERAVRRMPHAELLRFGEEARHEILREVDMVRNRALSHIGDFLDRTAPLSPADQLSPAV